MTTESWPMDSAEGQLSESNEIKILTPFYYYRICVGKAVASDLVGYFLILTFKDFVQLSMISDVAHYCVLPRLL